MNEKKKAKTAKQGPPLQFRPGPDLERLVAEFAAQHGLQVNEAVKVLVALAVTALDRRYYSLMEQLAAVMGSGPSAFVRACIHIRTALDGGALAIGRPLQREPERSRLILQVVDNCLKSKGLEVRTDGLWFLPEMARQQQEVGEKEDAPEWSAFEKVDERVRERS
jgi:hypothetical protein